MYFEVSQECGEIFVAVNSMCFYRIIDIPVYQVHRYFYMHEIFFNVDCMLYLTVVSLTKRRDTLGWNYSKQVAST